MVLGDDLYCEMILLDVDIRVVPHRLHQSTLDFRACVVSVVEDAEFRVSALTMQVEGAVFFLVEVHTPFHEFLDLLGCHGVLDVLVEIVQLQVCY